jgi:uncharacterized protein
MKLEFDQVKRDKTLLERGLDFARAVEVFDGIHFTGQDKRMEYEKDRFITAGWLVVLTLYSSTAGMFKLPIVSP